MTGKIPSDWDRVKKARENAKANPDYKRIGSNRVPEDDPSYNESSEAVSARISYIVQNTLM